MRLRQSAPDQLIIRGLVVSENWNEFSESFSRAGNTACGRPCGILLHELEDADAASNGEGFRRRLRLRRWRVLRLRSHQEESRYRIEFPGAGVGATRLAEVRDVTGGYANHRAVSAQGAGMGPQSGASRRAVREILA